MCKHTRACVRAFVCMHVCVNAYVHVRSCVCVHACALEFVCMSVCAQSNACGYHCPTVAPNIHHHFVLMELFTICVGYFLAGVQ